MAGRPVPGGYNLDVKDARVAGGRDGCNMWGWGEESVGGERAIQSTLIGCEETAEQRAYWMAVRDERARLSVGPDGMLSLEGGGQQLLARRVTLADKAGWSVTHIDGEPAPLGYSLDVSAGRLTGGYDGCNSWYWDQAARRHQPRSLVATEQGCENNAVRRSYWVAVRDENVRMATRPDGMLVVEGGGHHLIARPRAAEAEAPTAPSRR